MKSTASITRREFGRRTLTAALGAATVTSGSVLANAATDEGNPARGIWKIDRRPKILEEPLGMPPGEIWRYLLCYPFQVAPTRGAVYCNMKISGGPGQDAGGGTDIVVFDRLDGIRAENAVKVSRNFTEPNPNDDNRPAYFATFPGLVGFVPFGAHNAAGRPHPHAGTGFVLVPCAAWPLDGKAGFATFPDRIGLGVYRGPKAYRAWNLFQLRYDGTNMHVGTPRRLAESAVVPGHLTDMTGMSCAIADGDELLMTICASSAKGRGCGVQRWRRVNGEWGPGEYERVSPLDDSIEPSLVRDLDGALLFAARGRRNTGPLMRVWRRAPNGTEWKLSISINGLLNSTPVTLNRAVDGTPYIASNLYQPEFKLPAGLYSDGGISRLEPVGWRGERSTICIWPLNEARDGLDAELIARDPRSEFGLPPHGTVWAVDHPTAGVVRLADGQWHALMGYRMLEWKENTHFIPPSPQTGCYLDEIFSFGEPAPLWNFQTSRT